MVINALFTFRGFGTRSSPYSVGWGVVLCLAVATALAAVGEAQAQQLNVTNGTTAGSESASSSSLQEIIVTATRREERLSKVPVSVSAYSQETMENLGIRTFEDISKLTPGVNLVQNSARTGSAIAIRGIDSRVGAGTVGIYIDDTPIQVRTLGFFATNIYPQIFDLERVEVLRGPQGTLFGAGSEGGTVRLITPQPSLTRDSLYGRGEIAMTEGGGLSYETGMAAGAPIIDGVLGFRGSAWYRRDGGWIDRIDPDTGATTSKDNNSQETYAVKAALAFAPNENVGITPAIFYQRNTSRNSNEFWNVQADTPGTYGVPQLSKEFNTPLSDIGRGVFKNGDPLDQPGTVDFLLSSVKIQIDTGPITIISTTSNFNSDSTYALDYSIAVPAVITSGNVVRIPGFTAFTDQANKQNNWTTELRIEPSSRDETFNWLVGFFYAHQSQRSIEGISGANNDLLAGSLFGVPNGNAVFGPNLQPGNYALVAYDTSLDKQYAAFSEISYMLTPKLKATAGMRVARSQVDFEDTTGGPFSGPLTTSRSSSESTPVTPKFGISYQMTDASLLYGTASKGYRVGGGNGRLPSDLCQASLTAIGLDHAPVSYRPDSLWSYEVGSKNRLFDNKLQIDASAFYIRWKNLQQQIFLPCQFQYVDNAGSAESKGFDIQISAQPITGVTLTASAGYVDAKYTSNVFPGPIAGSGANSMIVANGDTIGNPPWVATFTGRYDFSIGRAKAYFMSDYNYRSHNNGRSPVQDPSSISYDPGIPIIPASEIVNARVGMIFGSWDASLFVNNVFDAADVVFYRHYAINDPLYRNASFRPRTFGLTMTLKR